jgi:DNA polymerase/3'-5' exonuclease PolX
MLNEYGLYKLNGDKKMRIKITTEKDIFDKLGMEYLPPEKRE